jgi:hypothetical protein
MGRRDCQAGAYRSLSALISSMKESNGCQSSMGLFAGGTDHRRDAFLPPI